MITATATMKRAIECNFIKSNDKRATATPERQRDGMMQLLCVKEFKMITATSTMKRAIECNFIKSKDKRPTSTPERQRDSLCATPLP